MEPGTFFPADFDVVFSVFVSDFQNPPVDREACPTASLIDECILGSVLVCPDLIRGGVAYGSTGFCIGGRTSVGL
jgi:hypothetical protein